MGFFRRWWDVFASLSLEVSLRIDFFFSMRRVSAREGFR